MLTGTIGQVKRARPHNTGCSDIGITKARIIQQPETIKPTMPQSSILRFMLHLSLSDMVRRFLEISGATSPVYSDCCRRSHSRLVRGWFVASHPNFCKGHEKLRMG